MSNEESNEPEDKGTGIVESVAGASVSGEIILPADESGEGEAPPPPSEPPDTRDENGKSEDPEAAASEDDDDENLLLHATGELDAEALAAEEAKPQPTQGHGHGHGPPPGERKHYFDHPKNVEKLLRYFYIGCAALVVIGVFNQYTHLLYHPHPAFPEGTAFADGGFEESIPAFYCMYGFVACTLLVIAATQLRKVLMRREDYYDV